MSYWDTKSIEVYSGMFKRHPKLWQFVEDFIKDHEVESVLEIGCGLVSPVRNWVKEYQAVDVNESSDAIHENFLFMDTAKFRDIDLVVACGVIEHCENYTSFFEQINKIQPKYALISFFNDINREEDFITITTKDPIGEFNWNRYSRRQMDKKLDELGLKHYWIHIKLNEDILICG